MARRWSSGVELNRMNSYALPPGTVSGSGSMTGGSLQNRRISAPSVGRRTGSIGSVASVRRPSGSTRRPANKKKRRVSSSTSTDSEDFFAELDEGFWFGVKRKIVEQSYLLTTIVQVLMIGSIYIADVSSKGYPPNVFAEKFTIYLALVLQIVQLLVILWVAMNMLKDAKAKKLSIIDLFKSYVATIISFAGIYYIMVRGFDRSSLKNIAWTTDNYAPIILFVDVFYFSSTTMTTVGFGDIVPNRWYTIVLVVLQQCLSVLFTSVIFSMGINHFKGDQYYDFLLKTSSDSDKNKNKNKSRNKKEEGSDSQPVKPTSVLYHVRVQMAKYCLPITLVCQAIVFVLVFANPDSLGEDFSKAQTQTRENVVVVAIMAVIQLGVLAIVVATSYQLIQDVSAKSFSSWFLINSFISTILSFAGLYTLVQQALNVMSGGVDGFDGLSYQNRLGLDIPRSPGATPGQAHSADIVFRFVYFSNTVMTTVGFGDILPFGPVAKVLVVTQQIVSVVYSTIIFSAGVS